MCLGASVRELCCRQNANRIGFSKQKRAIRMKFFLSVIYFFSIDIRFSSRVVNIKLVGRVGY